MQRIVELELWTMSKKARRALDGNAIAEACRFSLGFSEEIVLGLNFVPDHTDVINLSMTLKNKEATLQEFEFYCIELGMIADVKNMNSAAQFLAWKFGQPLAWLHFPETLNGLQMALDVSAWAKCNEYIIKVGQGEPPLQEAQLKCIWHQ